MSASSYELDSAVWGFYEYQSILTRVIGKELLRKREMHNPHDSFAVAETKDHVVIGYLPISSQQYFGHFCEAAQSLALYKK